MGGASVSGGGKGKGGWTKCLDVKGKEGGGKGFGKKGRKGKKKGLLNLNTMVVLKPVALLLEDLSSFEEKQPPLSNFQKLK